MVGTAVADRTEEIPFQQRTILPMRTRVALHGPVVAKVSWAAIRRVNLGLMGPLQATSSRHIPCSALNELDFANNSGWGTRRQCVAGLLTAWSLETLGISEQRYVNRRKKWRKSLVANTFLRFADPQKAIAAKSG